MSIDNKIIYSCIVLITSLLDNKAKSSFYIIHILYNNSTLINPMNKIDKVLEKFGNNSAKIIYHNLGNDFKGAPTELFPLAAYYRISLPSLLSNIDKVLYTDVDVVNLKDLSEMYNIKFKDNNYICGSLDFFKTSKELTELGINVDKYINSGTLLMNLKLMQKLSIEQKLREFVKTHILKTADQTAINAICNNNIQILPYKYASFAFDSFDKLIELNNGQNPMYRFNESELR